MGYCKDCFIESDCEFSNSNNDECKNPRTEELELDKIIKSLGIIITPPPPPPYGRNGV